MCERWTPGVHVTRNELHDTDVTNNASVGIGAQPCLPWCVVRSLTARAWRITVQNVFIKF